MSNECARIFRPHQMGVGLPNGAEAATHACRRYLNHESSKGKVLLKIDMENAFNSIRRDHILKKAKEMIPSVYPMIWQAY